MKMTDRTRNVVLTGIVALVLLTADCHSRVKKENDGRRTEVDEIRLKIITDSINQNPGDKGLFLLAIKYAIQEEAAHDFLKAYEIEQFDEIRLIAEAFLCTNTTEPKEIASKFGALPSPSDIVSRIAPKTWCQT